MTYPNLKQSIWLMVLWLLITIGLGILINNIDKSLMENDFLKGLLSLTGLIVIICYVSRRTNRTWKDILLNINHDWRVWLSDWRVWLSIGLSILGLGIIISQLIGMVEYVIPIPEKIQRIFDAVLDTNDLLSLFFLAVIIGPFAEEVLCRGIILKGLLAYGSQNRAIIWSTILFGLMHLNPWQLPAAFIWGLVAACWVIQTGSLWPAILGHSLNNFLQVTFWYLEWYLDVPNFSEIFNVVVLNLCGVILAALGLWWFYQVANSKKIDHFEAGVGLEGYPRCDSQGNT